MRLEWIRYFVCVAEDLNFRRAAARLHISQPPLSFHIKMLEEELGIKLFHRTTRQVSLTEAGAAFLVKARRVLSLVEEATEEIKAIAAGMAGTIKIGFTISTSFNHFFYHSVYSYRREYPDVKVTLTEMISGLQIKALTEERIDVGFLRWPYELPPALTMSRLTQTELMLAVHHSHRLAALRHVSLARVKDEPFISYPANLGSNIGIYRSIQQLFEKAGFVPRIVQEALEPSVIIGFVAAGLGIAIVPASLQCIQIPGVIFKRIADRAAHMADYLVYRSADTSPRVRAFRELVQSACKTTPKTALSRMADSNPARPRSMR
jgi:DNA-binding transcriptional LysR family regulator